MTEPESLCHIIARRVDPVAWSGEMSHGIDEMVLAARQRRSLALAGEILADVSTHRARKSPVWAPAGTRPEIAVTLKGDVVIVDAVEDAPLITIAGANGADAVEFLDALDATGELFAGLLDALDADNRALRTEHDRRVTELLEANNREVERRRTAERSVAQLRAALLDIGRRVGALLDDRVSSEFLAGIAEEVRLVLERSDATLAEAAAYRAGLRLMLRRFLAAVDWSADDRRWPGLIDDAHTLLRDDAANSAPDPLVDELIRRWLAATTATATAAPVPQVAESAASGPAEHIVHSEVR